MARMLAEVGGHVSLSPDTRPRDQGLWSSDAYGWDIDFACENSAVRDRPTRKEIWSNF